MDELAMVFRFDRIADLHRTRTRSIRSVLSGAPEQTSDGTALEYALAHHFLEGAELAARGGDRDTLAWYRTYITAPPPHWSVPTNLGPRITQSPEPATLRRSPIAETPYHLLGPDTESAPPSALALATSAFDVATEFGFGDLVAQHAPIVCLLIERSLEDALNSWTITRLPGTVFLDHVGEPTILARDLIHEAGHNWLNDALTATGITIDDEHSYHSPWKNTQRPTFGYLHSCWAFPLTMIFAARASAHAIEQVRTVLTAYLAQHRDKLATTTHDHNQALTAVTDPDLRERLRAVREMARKL
ncbi:aKG-HExxH-type peptide beta-hydroxylase [Nocardia gamkensis]|uniref:HEXXH motif domain-containing protein n=1 Tax=Nocardia gamkensis TaxID=352869 RepID=A0A7X6R767_9NOCA|nr:HEXXH motif-containing putative peptide modification protein [Nocardia gamkensis]NKY31284.1 HEXXH motif domain-containing protein [Nocardia gamkensis]